jgi:hypothetical protein
MGGLGDRSPYELFPRDPGRGVPRRGPAPPDQPARWLRQLLTLTLAALVAFAGTVWGLVHFESASDQETASLEATEVVEQQLAALKRGDLEGAYRQFSERYRREVPFELFHDLVVEHWSMFRARQVKFDPGEEVSNRILLRTHILAFDGRNYEADFTLLRAGGRWWIDDLHWSAPSDEGGFIRVRARPRGVLTARQAQS